MNIGYSQENVESAIIVARQKYGTSELRAQYILVFLLDNNYTPSSLPEVNAAASSGNTTTSHTSTSTISSEQPSNSPDLQRLREDIFQENENDEETRHLLDENRALKQQMTCKVCMVKDACIVCMPCGHMVACVGCAVGLRKCAVCRNIIQGTVRAYPG